MSCGVALVAGLILAPLALRTPDSGGTAEPEPTAATALRFTLPTSETAIVNASESASDIHLQGQLHVATSVSGRTPAAGEVARQLVDAGGRVTAGQPVVEISTGPNSRVAPGEVHAQTAAEQGQIRAADAQNALALKIAAAQTRLQAAQARVQSAQTRVTAMRAILAKLRNGEEADSGDLPSDQPAESPRHARPSGAKAALRAAERARKQSSEAAAALSDAQATLREAERNAREAVEKLKVATANVDKTSDLFDKGVVAGSEVETARSNAIDAQNAATEATNAAYVARQAMDAASKRADETKTAADDAQSRADDAVKTTPLFDDSESPSPAPAPRHRGSISIGDAVVMAQAALQESRDATAEADKISAEITAYQDKVSQSKATMTGADQRLSSAEQRLMDSVPRASFVPVVAPVAGMVTWLAPLARQVRDGDPVFGLSSSGNAQCTFPDNANLWHDLRLGASFAGLLLQPNASPATVPAQPLFKAVTRASHPLSRDSGQRRCRGIGSDKAGASPGSRKTRLDRHQFGSN